MPSLIRKGERAFTLLELIVVIVILGVLAAIAIPTFNLVVDRSKDRAAETSLAAVAREAAALAAFRDEEVTVADFDAAASDMGAYAPGPFAASSWIVSGTGYSDRYALVSARTSDGTGGLAMESVSGNCVFVRLTSGGAVESWNRDELGANCNGAVALLGPENHAHDQYSEGVAAPTNLVATPADGSVTLEWTAAAGALSYTVYQDGKPLPAVSGTSTSRAVTGLVNGTTYTFSVSATDGVGEGPRSAEVTARPVTATPGTPTGLKGTAGDTVAELSWTAPSPAPSGGYRLYRDGVKAYEGTALTTSVTGLTNGTSYTFTVSSFDVYGQESAPSAGVVVKPVPPAPLTPTGLAAKGLDGSVHVTWDALVPAPAKYRLYRDGVLVYEHTDTFTYVTGLVNGTSYTFTVSALDSFVQESPKSAGVSATPYAAPATPQNVTGASGDQSVTFSWDAVASTAGAPVSGYHVYLDSSASPTRTITGTTTTFTGLANGSTHTVQVAAYGPGGVGTKSSVVEATASAYIAAMRSGTTPYLWWRLGEWDYPTAYDSSGNGRHGSIGGATLRHPSALASGEDRSMAFNGSGTDHVTSYAPAAGTNSFAYEVWVHPYSTHEVDVQTNTDTAGVSGQKYVWGAGHGGDFAAGAGLSVGTNGISVYEHGSGYMPATAVWSGSLSGWNHVVVNYVDRTPHIYLNGVLVRTGLQSARSTVTAPGQLGLGSYGSHYGALDEAAVYSTPLSAAEIKAHYDAGRRP